MGMNENESYLDSLLRAVMEPKVEEPVVEEPMIEEVPEIEEIADILEVPEIEEVPTIFEVPEIEEVPDILEVPEIEEVPDILEVPGIEEIPDILEVPEIEEIPAIFGVPDIEEIDETFIEEVLTEEVQPEVVNTEEVQMVEETETENDFMQMPEFVMDEETAKEVEAMLNFDFGVSSIPEYTETPEAEAEQPIIEEVGEEYEQPIIEEVAGGYEQPMIEEVPDEFAMEDFADIPDGLPSELLSGGIEYVADEVTYSDESLIGDETAYADEPAISEEDTVVNEPEINDDLLDLDIENLLGMESIETDDSELEDNNDSFGDDLMGDVEVITPTMDDNSIVGAPSLEDAAELSQEDIERLLTESSQVDAPATEDDLFALLSGGGDEVASAEDLFALLGEADGESASYAELTEGEVLEDNEEGKSKKKKKNKKAKASKNEEDILDEDKTEKKQGVFQKFITFLTESDEDDEDKKSTGQGEMVMTEAQMADLFSNVSDENQEIMDELDKEDKSKKKVKRKKKDKKKDKKNDEEAVAIDAEESEVRAKPKVKKTKEKKAKKEKRVSVDDLDTSGKKLSKKKVIITFSLIITIMIAILLVNYLYAGAQVLKKARNAYYNQNYDECYQILYGKELNESDKIIYKRSELMLKMSRSIESYETYMEADMPIQALDSLIQGIGRFEALRVEAILLELEQDAERIYGDIVEHLGIFGVTEQKALDIYNSESDEEYTNQLIDVLENGTPIVDEEEEPEKEYLYDALPVEEEIN